MQVYSFIFLGMLFLGKQIAVSKIHEDLKWIMIYLLNDTVDGWNPAPVDR